MCAVLFCGVAFVSLASVTNIPSASRISRQEPLVLKVGKRISGLTVPADTNSFMIAGAEKFNSLSTNTWSKGNTSFSVAVCVGIKFGGGLPRQVVFRDFSYDEEGRLMHVSAEYTDKNVRDAAERNEIGTIPTPATNASPIELTNDKKFFPPSEQPPGVITNLGQKATSSASRKSEIAWGKCKG